jgi:hydrophobe/amphiphile efflux-3 (HAE3) family protein
MKQWLERLSGFGEQRPRVTLVLFLVLALICAGVALSLQPSANINTLVNSSSADYQATQRDYREFGGDTVDVLVHGKLTSLVGATDLAALTKLEACLGGNEVTPASYYFVQVPAAKATPYGGTNSACGHLMKSGFAEVVYGPATFLNQAVEAVDKEISSISSSDSAAIKTLEARAVAAAKAKGLSAAQQQAAATEVGQLEQDHDLSQLLALAQKAGLTDLTSLPSITNAAFIDKIVFATTGANPTPKARFSYLFPSPDSALIQVRLRPNLSTPQTAEAIRWIRSATQMETFALGGSASYLVSGEPVVLNEVSASLSGQIAVLLIGAVVVMAAVLLLIFRRRLRLLPLGLALASAAITFGLDALAGGTLTMASIAVLPILIGLAVDYGIQFQSRASGAPTIAAAALATATGFLVLLLSPVPMVRGFGLLLVLGVGVAFVVVLIAGSAVLSLGAGTPRLALPGGLRAAADLPLAGARLLLAPLRAAGVALLPAVRGAAELLTASLRGAGDIVLPRRLAPAPGARANGASGAASGDAEAGRRLGATLSRLSARPRTILVVGLILAVAGWVADTQTSVQSDITKLVPTNTAALQGLLTLEKVTGQSGELDIVVHAKDVATPAVIEWMETYENAITKHFGSTDSNGCHKTATVCPALSLPDLFSATSGTSSSAAKLTQADITRLLTAVPAYFSSAVINPSRTYAALTFGIRLMPLSRQIRVVNYLRTHLNPPAGVTAQLAGLPVLAADADSSLSSSARRLLTLVAGILAVALMLMAIFRRPKRALIPLVPIVLATGWSALIVWAIGIPLNPMSATLGALVIAISTEFSVLLAERFRHQRAEGESLVTALESAYASTGRAVVASGITAIAGFAVLIVSNVTMLRDFGLVTLIDMTVSLLGVLAVLPAVLTLSEGGLASRVPSRQARPKALRAWRPAPRRPRPGVPA